MQTVMIVEDDPDIRDGVRIAPDCNRVWVDEQEADLTETEYKILKLLMQSPQRIFTVQGIYETVWGEPYFYVSNGTVMVHIRNLRMAEPPHCDKQALLSERYYRCAFTSPSASLPSPSLLRNATSPKGRGFGSQSSSPLL